MKIRSSLNHNLHDESLTFRSNQLCCGWVVVSDRHSRKSSVDLGIISTLCHQQKAHNLGETTDLHIMDSIWTNSSSEQGGCADIVGIGTLYYI